MDGWVLVFYWFLRLYLVKLSFPLFIFIYHLFNFFLYLFLDITYSIFFWIWIGYFQTCCEGHNCTFEWTFWIISMVNPFDHFLGFYHLRDRMLAWPLKISGLLRSHYLKHGHYLPVSWALAGFSLSYCQQSQASMSSLRSLVEFEIDFSNLIFPDHYTMCIKIWLYPLKVFMKLKSSWVESTMMSMYTSENESFP